MHNLLAKNVSSFYMEKIMQKKTLMTSGNIPVLLLKYSIPLLLGNLFQLLYNTVDSIVVGRYVGDTALAAVGTSAPIVNLVIGFFMGLSTGASVVISRYYGAQRDRATSKAVHTFVTFSLIFGTLLSIVGVLCSRYFLMWMNVPDNVFDQAQIYLSIYFLGAIAICMYNGGTGIFRAVGDSKHPLYFLLVSSVVNIVLDLLFVKKFNMGVSGVAWATLIAQVVSCILVCHNLLTNKDVIRLEIKKLRIDFPTLASIVRIGIPAGIQSMIVSFSNVIVQAYINNFGAASIAGFTSANKFNDFLGMPVNSYSLAVTTFVGQNLGAKEFDRISKGIKWGIVIALITVFVLGGAFFTFSDQCISIFSKDIEVIKAGSVIMHILIPGYVFLVFHQLLSGSLRASGRSMVPMWISIISFTVVRQIFLAITMPIFQSMAVIGWGYTFTWAVACTLTTSYNYGSRWLAKEKEKYGVA